MFQNSPNRPRCLIIGGGFTGLAAAHELTRKGISVVVLEKEPTLGGLAGGFDIGGFELERFYHHWFLSDRYVMDLVQEIGKQESIVSRESRTGMYYANSFFRLSTPADLLKFNALPFIDRLKLGIGVLRARAVKDWMKLEHLTAKDWLLELFGRRVFKVVWEPLLSGKFGSFSDEISAVWFWKKLVLRGGSRGKGGAEMLAYYKGGFAALARNIGDAVTAGGGSVLTGVKVLEIKAEAGRATTVSTTKGDFEADYVLLTTPLPIAASLLKGAVDGSYVTKLERIRYLANICLILELDRSLSDTYWLNVNDPGFPFVGIIEHTNFEPPESYGNRHIVYLSRYLPKDDPIYSMDRDQLLEFALPHLRRMFPTFDRSWVQNHHAWRADSAQPIVERHYSKLVPQFETPLSNLFISTMAQVYPEDRGTNYAIREGKIAASRIEALCRT